MEKNSNIFSIDILSINECISISNYILEMESEIKSLGEDIYSKTCEDSLTGRFALFNYLNHFPGEILVPKLKKIFGSSLIQCWANIFRINEGIDSHYHGRGFVSANIFLSGDPNIGTYYNNQKFVNKPGSLVIFPSEIVHYVPPNTSSTERISLALDIHRLDTKNISEKDKNNKTRFFIL